MGVHAKVMEGLRMHVTRVHITLTLNLTDDDKGSCKYIKSCFKSRLVGEAREWGWHVRLLYLLFK